eukprot:CAMPEP_0115361438 /NCGR_PEP_ID=MMETSP0270-20121206/102200_1 /TAXON_ID=71861 /ORGANISM="Scrippsiella trochoidea, Strain CCMP3099" /LENGTH=148 /DNA_ID=CAMNT_0002783999 /DNA_START=210 /DNA_END=652 /DNA_ORIENTATION=+
MPPLANRHLQPPLRGFRDLVGPHVREREAEDEGCGVDDGALQPRVHHRRLGRLPENEPRVEGLHHRARRHPAAPALGVREGADGAGHDAGALDVLPGGGREEGERRAERAGEGAGAAALGAGRVVAPALVALPLVVPVGRAGRFLAAA